MSLAKWVPSHFSLEYKQLLEPGLMAFFVFLNNNSVLYSPINMNETLLSQYVNGKKEPSEKQINKILAGVKELGKELMQLEIA